MARTDIARKEIRVLGAALLRQTRRAGVRRRRAAQPKLSAADRWVLSEVDALLVAKPASSVAILQGERRSSLPDLIRAAHPRATVTVAPVSALLAPARSAPPSLHTRLAVHGPHRLIADVSGTVEEQAELYRAVLFHLAPGGRLLLPGFRPGLPAPRGLWPLLHRLVALQDAKEQLAPANGDEAALAAATGQVVVTGSRLSVTNTTPALAKIHEAEIDFVLAELGGSAGRVLEHIEAETFTQRCVIRDHAAESRVREPVPIEVPRLSLREYDDVLCLPGQVTVRGNLLLPDTYRHFLWSRLVHRRTDELAPMFAQLQPQSQKPRQLEGPYFQWDDEHAGHFGHLMTEQLSRLWAWRAAKARHPDLRLLLHRLRTTDPIASYEREILHTMGIEPADVELITGPVRVTRLVAATPMFSIPQYVSPRILDTWREIGRGAEAAASLDPAAPRQPRIFLSRRKKSRWCHNREAVEQTFAEFGFEILFPEELSFPAQAAKFRNADVVAGFAGSALFTLAMCDGPKRVLIVSSQRYTPHNEYLMAAARGDIVDIFWSVEDEDVVTSPFTFDFDREGRHLRRVLAELDEPN